MPVSGVQGEKRKRSESIDPEETHLHRSSPPPPTKLSSREQESSIIEQLSVLPSTGLEPVPTLTTTVLPLTRSNLTKLDPTMASKSATPSKEARENSSVASSESNVQNMVLLLEKHHYYVANENVQAQNQDFINRAGARIAEDRMSPMKSEQLLRVKKAYETAKLKNELTFLTLFWTNLIAFSRTVKQGEDWQNLPRTSKDWQSDFITANLDHDFLKDSVDEIKPANDPERLLLDAMPKIKTPKPDMIYGLTPKGWCSEEESAAIAQFSRHSMPSFNLVSPSFLIEGKSLAGNLEVAEVQAMRGGAALNASFRRLDKEAGTMFEGDGPDERSMVYSLVIGPMYARLNVHWAHLNAGEVVAYYTHRLKYYIIAEMDSCQELRSAIHNILDWTAFERKNMVKQILGAIVEKDKRIVAERKGGKSTGSGSRATKKQKTDDGEAAASSVGSKSK